MSVGAAVGRGPGVAKLGAAVPASAASSSTSRSLRGPSAPSRGVKPAACQSTLPSTRMRASSAYTPRSVAASTGTARSKGIGGGPSPASTDCSVTSVKGDVETSRTCTFATAPAGRSALVGSSNVPNTSRYSPSSSGVAGTPCVVATGGAAAGASVPAVSAAGSGVASTSAVTSASGVASASGVTSTSGKAASVLSAPGSSKGCASAVAVAATSVASAASSASCCRSSSVAVSSISAPLIIGSSP